MELVYLWVKDYKNIKKQGFNFSPRFHCEYNKDENELTIDKNDDYIPDFFGENINVTAIVGKNGSGKSSVLEYLADSPKFIVTFEENQFFINQDVHIKNRTNYNFIFNNDFFLKKNISHIHIVYSEGKDAVGEIHTYMFKKQSSMFFNSKNKLDKIIFPKKIFYSFDYDFLELISDCIHSEVHPLLSKKKLEKMSLSEIIYIYLLDEFVSRSKRRDLNNILFIFFKKYQNILSSKELFLKFKKELDTKEDIDLYNKVYTYAQLFQGYTDTYREKKLVEERKDEGWRYKKEIRGESLYNISLENNSNIKKILEEQEYYEGHYFRWNIKLSAGELSFINLLSEIFDKIKNSNDIKYLYLDEYETFLHPNWQKKYLSYIVQFIKDNFPNRKIHIILTSHSPFLLSDIPKQNIIFLDKDEKGNCKVVDGLKEKKQTFGANIHTLLSDSFFMEDGLMGEFAKSKIDKAITLLNKEQLTQDDLKYCEQIISIIGEPIVKNQLQRMLDSKRLKKVDEIDAIKKSMLEMKKRLDELER